MVLRAKVSVIQEKVRDFNSKASWLEILGNRLNQLALFASIFVLSAICEVFIISLRISNQILILNTYNRK